MYATPLSYYTDDPMNALAFIESLDEEHTKTYAVGYVQACQHVQEALTDSKREFLTAALGAPDEVQIKLFAYVRLLDALEDTLSRRVNFLKFSVLASE